MATNNIPNHKDTEEINDTQLDITANNQGIHVELGISWQRLHPMTKIGGIVLSHLFTLGLTTFVNLPSLPPPLDRPTPPVEKLECPSPKQPTKINLE